MDLKRNPQRSERVADRLAKFGQPEPRHLDELPAGPGPTGAETALQAAFLLRLMQITGGHHTTVVIPSG